MHVRPKWGCGSISQQSNLQNTEKGILMECNRKNSIQLIVLCCHETIQLDFKLRVLKLGGKRRLQFLNRHGIWGMLRSNALCLDSQRSFTLMGFLKVHVTCIELICPIIYTPQQYSHRLGFWTIFFFSKLELVLMVFWILWNMK